MKSFKNDILENGNNENKKVNTFPKDFRKHLKDLTRKYKSFKKEKEKKENPIKDESKENIKEKIITTNNSHLTSEISILRENTQRNDTNEYYNIKSYKNSFEGQNFSFQKFNYLQTDKPETLKNYEQYKNILEQKICELKKKLSNENNKNNFEEIRKIKINKFIEINKINIKANPFITFIQMLDSKDLYSLFRTCKEIKQLIINALIFEVKTFISNKFEQLSKGVFSNNIYLLCFHTYYENQNKYLQIFLIIKSKLTSKMLCNKSVHLQYYANFPYDKSEYVLNHFIFDIKSNELHFWIMKESTNFYEDNLNKAYFMHIMQYKLNDYAEFTINIFTYKGLMNIRKLKWQKIKLFKTPKEDYYEYNKENILKRELVDYDMSRYCELEICKGNWHDIILMDNKEHYNEIINIFDIMFKENFKILKILFDDVGYYIFKIYLKAIKIGEIGENKENHIGITIKINKKNDIVSNECKKNNLIFDRKNEIEMHIDDILVFYFSKNKI